MSVPSRGMKQKLLGCGRALPSSFKASSSYGCGWKAVGCTRAHASYKLHTPLPHKHGSAVFSQRQTEGLSLSGGSIRCVMGSVDGWQMAVTVFTCTVCQVQVWTANALWDRSITLSCSGPLDGACAYKQGILQQMGKGAGTSTR